MKSILVPSDHSLSADNAAEYAFHIAEAANKEVIFFHAGLYDSRTPPEFQKNFDSDILVKTSKVVLQELPHADELRRIINKHHVRLAVMGSVGAGSPLNKKMFGTFTENFISVAPCPVIAVPPAHKFRWINKIGFATDLTKIDNEIGKVISFAKIFNSEVEIYHMSDKNPEPLSTENYNIRDKIELFKRLHQYSNISYLVEEMPVDNEINECINVFLGRKHVDLLILFNNKGRSLEEHFSSGHTTKTANHLMVPVMIYPGE